MTDRYIRNTQELESINSDLFNSFEPDQELWIIGGSGRTTFDSFSSTYNAGHADTSMDYDITW